MKLRELIDALKAVRDPDTNHRGLLALKRQLSRSRPASDTFLSALLTASPDLTELHAIWDIQTSGKDLKTTLELLSCTTVLLSYTPSPSCTAAVQHHILAGQDQFATAVLQRRLKSLYFHLSCGNKLRSNAALALLTAVAGRGGSVLRELVSSFDFSHSALPKLARPPRLSAAAAAAVGNDTAAAAAGDSGSGSSNSQLPVHWESWDSPSVGRRPSRAVFVEWVATMLQTADALLLPVLLHIRPLMSGLLQHLSTDPPGVILGVLQLLHDKVLGPSSTVAAATQLELWGDSALTQLATIAAAAAGASAPAAAAVGDGANTAAAASRDAAVEDDLSIPGISKQQQHGTDSMEHDGSSSDAETLDNHEGDLDSDLSTDHSSDDDALDERLSEMQAAHVKADKPIQKPQQQQQQQQQRRRQQSRHDADAAAVRMQTLTAAAAAAAYDMLLLLLTHPTKGLVIAAGPPTAYLLLPEHQHGTETAAAVGSEPGSSKVARSSSAAGAAATTSGELRALRLLQRLQPGRSAAHARLLKAVAAAKPQLAAELLQVLPYNLEPKPCASWLACVAVTGLFIAAAATVPSALKAQVTAATAVITKITWRQQQQQLCTRSQHCSTGGSSSSMVAPAAAAAVSGTHILQPPDVSAAAFRLAVRSCFPSSVQKGLLSRGLQHSNSLVISATLTLMQQCLAAAAMIIQPVEQLIAAAAALEAQQCKESATAAAAAAAGAAAAAASAWSDFLTQLRQSLRGRAPDISVLVAVATSLQRSAAAAAASEIKQQQQQQLVLLQCQALRVLEGYASCLPEAVADGHVDLAKLVLQGQELLAAPVGVQQAALDVLAAADTAAAAAAAAVAALPDPGSCTVAQLLPLLKLAAASPAAEVRDTAAALLARRLAPFCGSSSSSSGETRVWLQQLPQIWRLVQVSHNSSSSSSSSDTKQLYSRSILSSDVGSAGATDASDQNNIKNNSSISVVCDPEWLAAQQAVLGFVAEAAAAVARKPHEPWEIIQQALQQQQQQHLTRSRSSRSNSSSNMTTLHCPSLLVVCALKRLLRLLKSPKAAAAMKTAVCGYVCSVWQQQLQQQREQSAILLLLQQLLRDEAVPEWAGSSSSQETQQQQQHLVLPQEALPLVSLYNKAAALHAAAAAAAAAATDPSMPPGELQPHHSSSSSSKRRRKDSDAATAQISQVLYIKLSTRQQQQQQQQQQEDADKLLQLERDIQQLQQAVTTAAAADTTAAAAAAAAVIPKVQQLQLQLLARPACLATAAVGQLLAAAAAAAAKEIDSAAAAAAAVSYVVHACSGVICSHGLTLSQLLHHSSSSSSSSNKTLESTALTKLVLIFPSQQQQQQQTDAAPLPVSLLLQSCFEVCGASTKQAAAAASQRGSTSVTVSPLGLVQSEELRAAILLQLQQLPVYVKMQLVGLVCCSAARAAAAAAAVVQEAHTDQQQQQQELQMMLVFGTQVLQSLMLHESDTGSRCSSSSSIGSNSVGSSSSREFKIDMNVAQAVLQHSILLDSFCQSGSHLLDAAAAAMTNTTTLLLLWLLYKSTSLPAIAAAAAAKSDQAAVQLACLCLPYFQKAVAVLQSQLDMLLLPTADSSSSSNDNHVAAALQLLQYLTIGGSSSSSTWYCIQAALQPSLQKLAETLMAVHSSSSSRGELSHPVASCANTSSSKKRKKAEQQQQTRLESAAPAPVWVQDVVATVSHVLLTHSQENHQHKQQQQQCGGELSPVQTALFKLLLQQFVNTPSAAVDAAVAAVLGANPAAAAAAAQHTQAHLLNAAATSEVLRACLTCPLTPARAAIAATVLKQNVSEVSHVFADRLGLCLEAAAAAKAEAEAEAASTGSEAAAAGRREALALLLPAAAECLTLVQQQQQQHGDAAAAPAADLVVSRYRPAMLAYMQRKRQKLQGQRQQSSQKHSTAATSGSSSGSSRELSAAAVANLQVHALPVLQLCLQASPLDSVERQKLLAKLLPAAGYPAAAAAESSSTVDTSATYEQQILLASWLIQQQHQDDGAAAAAAAGSDLQIQDAVAADHEDPSADPRFQQQQQQQLAELSMFVSSACSSLAAIFKQQPWQQQQQSSKVLQFTRSTLELLLLDQLNGWAGDLLADLPDLYRSTPHSMHSTGRQYDSPTDHPHHMNGSSSDDEISNDLNDLSQTDPRLLAAGRIAFAASLEAVQKLAVPLLQYRFGDDIAVRCLRRLLAALLPVGQEAVQTSNEQQQQQDQAEDMVLQDSKHRANPVAAAVDNVSDTADNGADAEASSEMLFDGAGSSSSGGNRTSSSSDAHASSDEEAAAERQQQQQQHASRAEDSQQGSDDSEMSDGDSSSSDADDTAAAAATVDEFPSEAESKQAPAAATVLGNPVAAAAASKLLQLLVSHSGFMPALLQQQQQHEEGLGLPPAVAAVPTPLESYMPIVDAVWICNDTSSSSSSSSNEFKHQLVLLLEVLLDMGRFFTAAGETEQQQQQQQAQGVDPKLLLWLLQLLQVAHGATLSDSDRAVHRVLLLLDKLAPQQQQQQQHDHDSYSGHDTAAAGSQPAPLAWPRCLFGEAANLYYKHHQQRQQQQQQQGDADFQKQLLQELCPLEPLRCALTVVLFPDRRCFNPDDESGGGDNLLQLYHNYSSSSSSCVCAGAPTSVAAAAYDPLTLLLLAAGVLERDALTAEGFASCGLLGVVLRALAAEDPGLRCLAYGCLYRVRASLDTQQNTAAAAAAAPPATRQQQLRSSKRSHQLTALLDYVIAAINPQQQQQLPAAAAVLAAEAVLLLAAPAAAMHSTVHKLLLRQQALDIAGLPLFGRIMSGGGSSSSKGGGGVKGAAAVLAERQWLMRLLWLGLRGPADARLYRRKYVCETLMALSGSAAANCCNNFTPHMQAIGSSTGGSSSSSSLDGVIIQVVRQAILLPGLASNLIRASGLLQWLAAAAVMHVQTLCGNGSSSSSFEHALTAVLLAGSAAAISEPLAPPAAAAESHCQGVAAAAAAPGASWALDCLTQLLSAHIALNKRDQAGEVYESYCSAVITLVTSVLQVTLKTGRSVLLPAAVLQQLLAVLVLLIEAAPTAKLKKQLLQLQLHEGPVQQLQLLVTQVCGASSSSSSSVGAMCCRQLWQQLLGLVRQQQHG